MDSSTSTHSHPIELQVYCEPSDFCVEVLTTTAPTGSYGDGDGSYDLLKQGKLWSATFDTEASFIEYNAGKSQDPHRIHELNDIASYDERECLLWCTDSDPSANSFDHLDEVFCMYPEREWTLRIRGIASSSGNSVAESLYRRIRNKGENASVKGKLKRLRGKKGRNTGSDSLEVIKAKRVGLLFTGIMR